MWSDQIIDPSFRGVSFEVRERDRAGGRRGPTHEFPQRDLPDAEDTGRKVRVFKVTGFVHGDDYHSHRDALLNALEKPGPGLYVDAWQGQWMVIARTYSCQESIERGGEARFSITFEESGEERFPSARANTRFLVSSATSELSGSLVAEFDQNFTLDGFPQFVSDAAEGITTGFTDDLMSGLQKIPGADNALVIDFAGDASNLVRDGLATSARDLVEGLAGSLYSDRASLPGDPLSTTNLFAGLSTFGSQLPDVPRVTATRQQQSTNQTAMVSLFKGLSLSAEAAAIARVSFDSFDAAHAARLAIGDRFDAALAVAGNAGQDTVYQSLTQARSAVVTDLLARSDGLPRVNQLVPRTSEPALVIAHRLWGDARRSDELLARNPHITHGGFVPAGTALEILNA